MRRRRSPVKAGRSPRKHLVVLTIAISAKPLRSVGEGRANCSALEATGEGSGTEAEETRRTEPRKSWGQEKAVRLGRGPLLEIIGPPDLDHGLTAHAAITEATTQRKPTGVKADEPPGVRRSPHPSSRAAADRSNRDRQGQGACGANGGGLGERDGVDDGGDGGRREAERAGLQAARVGGGARGGGGRGRGDGAPLHHPRRRAGPAAGDGGGRRAAGVHRRHLRHARGRAVHGAGLAHGLHRGRGRRRRLPVGRREHQAARHRPRRILRW